MPRRPAGPARWAVDGGDRPQHAGGGHGQQLPVPPVRHRPKQDAENAENAVPPGSRGHRGGVSPTDGQGDDRSGLGSDKKGKASSSDTVKVESMSRSVQGEGMDTDHHCCTA